MTQISGRGGAMTKAPGLEDDQNDELTKLEQTIAEAALADGSTPINVNPNAVDGENPLDAAGSTQTSLDTKSAEASQWASDGRQDVSSERSAQRTVGGRSQGIPQALGEKSDDEGPLSPAAIAAHIGRVRI